MEIKITMLDLDSFSFSQELKNEIVKNCSAVLQKKGEIALKQGDPVHRIPLYLSGESVLTRYSYEKDKNYVVCRVKSGETCPTSLSSVLSGQLSPITGTALVDSIKIIVPSHFVLGWQKQYPSWSKFLIKSLASGYSCVLDNFHQSLTQSVEERITKFLSSASYNQSKPVKLTHQELAQEIGSSRVVVSRILKNLESTGILKLGRGRITLNSSNGVEH